jgi:hypothetical protein
VQRFPIIGGNHLDGVPGATIEKSAIGTLAGTLLAANAKIRINLDTTKGRVIFIGQPKHASFDWTVFDAGGGTRTARAAISGYSQNTRPLFPRSFTITD